MDSSSVHDLLQRCIVVPSSPMINPASGLTVSASMIGDTDDISEPSSPESTTFDDNDLLTQAVHDEVTAQLAAAGPVGVAAAAAIVSGKKRRRPHSFETNPSIRKRQQTRLLRKLKYTLEEYTTRIGQQSVILCVTPGKQPQNQVYKCFGSQPLEAIIRNCRGVIMPELEQAIASQMPTTHLDGQYELPPVCVEGIPTPVDKMTQAQLRQFIPEMLKYSTGRSKPGWGKAEYRPMWWPSDLPWANVRSDVRSDEEKKRVSWTHALRTIVKNCYKHHGREDLMPEFEDIVTIAQPGLPFSSPTMVQTINNVDGSLSIIKIETNRDGHAVVTLGDGTQAHVVNASDLGAALQIQTSQEATAAVQTLAEIVPSRHDNTVTLTHSILQPGSINVSQSSGLGHTTAGGAITLPLEMGVSSDQASVATLAEATINADGQIILSGDASSLGGDAKFGMVIPVSMYQQVINSSSLAAHLSSVAVEGITTIASDQSLQAAIAIAQNGDDNCPYGEV